MIVAGKRTTRTPVARVAAYCPICRESGPCELVDVRRSNHALFVPFGISAHARYETRCSRCGTSVARDAYEPAPAPADPLDRRKQLEQPFHVLEAILQERQHDGTYGPVSKSVLAVFFLLCYGWFAGWLEPVFGDWWSWPVAFIVIAALVAVLVGGPLYVRREIEPRLVRALRPLRPTAEELAEVFANLRRRRLLIARAVHRGRLLALLRRSQPTG